MNLPCPPVAIPEEDARDAFLAQWRHALRTPLNALLCAVQVLEAFPADSAQAEQARGVIARQARQLAWLISDIPAAIPPAPGTTRAGPGSAGG